VKSEYGSLLDPDSRRCRCRLGGDPFKLKPCCHPRTRWSAVSLAAARAPRRPTGCRAAVVVNRVEVHWTGFAKVTDGGTVSSNRSAIAIEPRLSWWSGYEPFCTLRCALDYVEPDAWKYRGDFAGFCRWFLSASVGAHPETGLLWGPV
jgi:hypothetical protein